MRRGKYLDGHVWQSMLSQVMNTMGAPINLSMGFFSFNLRQKN